MADIKCGNNRFYIGETEENPKAEIDFYYDKEGCMVITHTRVSEELRGRGIAKQLVRKVVDAARMENRKIDPVCSYARVELNCKEYEDCLKTE